jgi:hypothetical protein
MMTVCAGKGSVLAKRNRRPIKDRDSVKVAMEGTLTRSSRMLCGLGETKPRSTRPFTGFLMI